MQALPNILTELLSGKMGNEFVFAASKGNGPGYIQSVHKYTQPINPNTPAQQEIRTSFGQAVLFWKDAANKTIGTTSFVRANFNEEVNDTAKKMRYYGVPLAGANAGRQIMIAAAVAYQDTTPNAFAVLPQDMTLEAQLTALNTAVTSSLVAIETKIQKPKIGHIGQ
jgi:hypothetical protein